jgi:hypothetical protein
VDTGYREKTFFELEWNHLLMIVIQGHERDVKYIHVFNYSGQMGRSVFSFKWDFRLNFVQANNISVKWRGTWPNVLCQIRSMVKFV